MTGHHPEDAARAAAPWGTPELTPGGLRPGRVTFGPGPVIRTGHARPKKKRARLAADVRRAIEDALLADTSALDTAEAAALVAAEAALGVLDA